MSDDLPDDVINVERHLLDLSLVRERADAPNRLCVPKIRFVVDAAGGRRKLAS